MKVAFFGECMVELSGDPLRRTFGGDTLNTALYLARLGGTRDIQVSYATGLGDDPLSNEMKQAWNDEYIEIQLIETISGKQPGLYLVETDATGERTFLYWRSDSAAKYYFDNAVSKLEVALAANQFDALYLSGISLAILNDSAKQRVVEMAKNHHASGKKVIFDNNFRPQLWNKSQARGWYEMLLPFVDIALLTEDDDIEVWGDTETIESRCERFGINEVVIKRGGEPCKLLTRDKGKYHTSFVFATRVMNVVDTCAAGDSFAAGYLAARLSGDTNESSAKFAHSVAAVVIQHSGAIVPLGAMDHLL
ncbi:2-dehydro-3-deoxygluconokinase [Vibrio thalassae]|uniref:2-dehydro-3-deoxygluconokinase n=1 Tax=Vibrio thalassae TaxID=1243014 RepID=A0A240EJS5_9VIBR|nr:sugar kinase [Vibrio thalassae]SNX48503.1 2-dehydro-3-deoxygluconokinase [Vibrio thalassae]